MDLTAHNKVQIRGLIALFKDLGSLFAVKWGQLPCNIKQFGLMKVGACFAMLLHNIQFFQHLKQVVHLLFSLLSWMQIHRVDGAKYLASISEQLYWKAGSLLLLHLNTCISKNVLASLMLLRLIYYFRLNCRFEDLSANCFGNEASHGKVLL